VNIKKFIGIVNLLIFTGSILFPGNLVAASTFNHRLDPPPAIILFIGDGMGAAQRTAGRWASVGQEDQLAMDMLQYSGWSMTDNFTGGVTDSAAAATAMATGVKTRNGRISLDPADGLLPTILEQVQERGWAVGLVSTTQITHATPAAFAAHEISRSNYTSIALQIFEHGVDVILAGGEDDWLPDTKKGCYADFGHRTDGRNLIEEAINQGYIHICGKPGFDSLDLERTPKLLGLFADNGMPRPFTPTLAEMTETAITILSRDPDGFFLMVEGGQIDWAAHNNDAQNVIGDVIGFDTAVTIGRTYAQGNSNALIIVTADHETGGMSVDLTSSGDPEEDGPFEMFDSTPFYINWTTTGHTGVNVPTTAQGKLSDQLNGTFENTHIYTVMRKFLVWEMSLPLIIKQENPEIKIAHKSSSLLNSR
jgi:alkaline phosphatase